MKDWLIRAFLRNTKQSGAHSTSQESINIVNLWDCALNPVSNIKNPKSFQHINDSHSLLYSLTVRTSDISKKPNFKMHRSNRWMVPEDIYIFITTEKCLLTTSNMWLLPNHFSAIKETYTKNYRKEMRENVYDINTWARPYNIVSNIK